MSDVLTGTQRCVWGEGVRGRGRQVISAHLAASVIRSNSTTVQLSLEAILLANAASVSSLLPLPSTCNRNNCATFSNTNQKSKNLQSTAPPPPPPPKKKKDPKQTNERTNNKRTKERRKQTTNKQKRTNKETNKPANKQTKKQTSKHSNKEANKRTNMQTNKRPPGFFFSECWQWRRQRGAQLEYS